MSDWRLTALMFTSTALAAVAAYFLKRGRWSTAAWMGMLALMAGASYVKFVAAP